jgi:uncharacterized protein (TIGR03437 family)
LSAAGAQPYLISTVAGGAPPPTPVLATNASISPSGVATDPAGDVYFSSRNAVFKLDLSHSLTRIAGNSRPGFSGDGGRALDAQLNSPNGLAVDRSGSLYIADSGNGCVRRVSGDGLIATVAGVPIPSSDPGDGGLATKAALSQPFAVAFDAAGNLYIADTISIREVTGDGIINRIAGQGGTQISPTAMAVDSTGVVYIGLNSRVARLTAGGVLTTVAGSPNIGGTYRGEGGPASQAVLETIAGLAVNANGELYLAEAFSNRILRVARDGIISTVAGNGDNVSAGDGGPATAATIGGPAGLAFDAAGNLYVAELGRSLEYPAASGLPYFSDSGRRIRKIATSGTITTVAGNGTAEYSGDGSTATAAQLDAPWGVAADSGGNLYVSDSGNHTVRKIASSGIITTVAGTGIRGSTGDGGPATGARLNVPLGIALDGAGNIYVAECFNPRIRKISAAGVITTVAGNGASGYGGDGGPAVNAQLACPHGVAVDASGTLYIADTDNHRLRKVGPDGTISTIAGNGVYGFAGDGGPALNAQLYAPTSLAMDSSGNLYIADTGNGRIRRISRNGAIATVAGCADSGHVSSDDGLAATAAVLSGPQGVAVDAAGNLYIAETQGNHVRRVSASGVISTIAGRALYGYLAYYDGLSQHGYSGDGGPATSARLGTPYALAVDSNFNVYIADLPNGAVRMLKPSPIANAASMLAGPVAAGELVTLYGSGLGPEDLTINPPDATGAVSSEAAGTEVLFDGVAAPVIYTSATQVAALVPSISGSTTSVEVRYRGKTAVAFTVPVAPFAPALFTYDSTGRGLAAATDQDHSYNSFTSSAMPGDTVRLFATGVGLAAQPAAPMSVIIGGVTAQILHVGPALGQLGVTEIDVKVPMDALAATRSLYGFDIHVPVSVLLQVGETTSQPGVYITVYINVLG